MLGRRTLALIATAGLGLAPSLYAQDVVRSATGERQADMAKMELQAFPADAWGKLTAWAQGDALTPAKLDGKPVLIITWSSWHPASVKALAIGQRMQEKHGKDGLIVVGVHGAMGWDKAADVAKTRGATFLLAHDEKGEFRKALKVSTDPDYYIIDRAGHLRYGALTPGSVEAACDEVVKNQGARQRCAPPPQGARGQGGRGRRQVRRHPPERRPRLAPARAPRLHPAGRVRLQP